MLFAYLAVRPTVQAATADGGHFAPDQPFVSVKVESVPHGDLTAKMQAMNQCASSNGWRVLLGFYVTSSAWKKCVRAIWVKAAATRDWENCVREGLKVARKHGAGSAVYVSTAARCKPESPLLTSLQSLRVVNIDAFGDVGVIPPKEFWKLIVSRRSTKSVNAQLKCFSTAL